MRFRFITSPLRWARRRTVAAATLAALCALGLSACGQASSPAALPGPVSIGISLSLNGDFADPGRAALRGYQLWADSVNAGGGILGRRVQLTVLDDGSDPGRAARNYRTLITRDKVNLVLGPFSTLLTAPSALVARRYGYAFVEPAGGGPSVFAEKLHNLFFVQQASVIKQGAVFAQYILSLPRSRRPRTAAYARLDDPFAAPIANYIRAKLQAAGIRTVFQSTYSPTRTNFTPLMRRVAAAHPDVLVSGTQSLDAYAQVKALIKVHFKPKWFYLSNGANSPTEFPDQVGAQHVDGLMSGSDWLPSASDQANADFIRAYLAKFGGTAQNIDPTSAEAFSAGVLLQDVADRTGRLDNATIIRSLHAGTWPTLLGPLSWNAIGQPQGSYTLVQWGDEQLTPVFPRARAQHAPAVSTSPGW
jgi:branched-chain amino acid transport system substrate-binding protein